MAAVEVSRDEKEARLNLRMEYIRRQNEALKKRHEEIEADKREAETHLFRERPTRKTSSEDKVPSQRPRPSQRHTVPSAEEKGLQGSGPSDPDRRRPQRLSEDDGPPPDPVYSFLLDRSREGTDANQDRHKDSRRHPGNYGGQSFENVRNSMQRRRAQERARPQQPPKNKMEMSMRMTGRERWEYDQWLSERSRIETDRINRQKTASGEWKREWDREKSYRNEKEDSPLDSGESQWNRRPRGRGRGQGRGRWGEVTAKVEAHDLALNRRNRDGGSDDDPRDRGNNRQPPKRDALAAPSSTPSTLRQVHVKEESLNVSISNDLASRLGSQFEDVGERHPRRQPMTRDQEERPRPPHDRRKDFRAGAATLESESIRPVGVPSSLDGASPVVVPRRPPKPDVDSDDAATVKSQPERRPPRPNRQREDRADRRREDRVDDRRADVPVRCGPVLAEKQLDLKDTEEDEKSKRPLSTDLEKTDVADLTDEESWDDEGSWEEATTSGNDSLENAECVLEDRYDNLEPIHVHKVVKRSDGSESWTADAKPLTVELAAVSQELQLSTQNRHDDLEPVSAPERPGTDPRSVQEWSGVPTESTVPVEVRRAAEEDEEDRERTPLADSVSTWKAVEETETEESGVSRPLFSTAELFQSSTDVTRVHGEPERPSEEGGSRVAEMPSSDGDDGRVETLPADSAATDAVLPADDWMPEEPVLLTGGRPEEEGDLQTDQSSSTNVESVSCALSSTSTELIGVTNGAQEGPKSDGSERQSQLQSVVGGGKEEILQTEEAPADVATTEDGDLVPGHRVEEEDEDRLAEVEVEVRDEACHLPPEAPEVLSAESQLLEVDLGHSEVDLGLPEVVLGRVPPTDNDSFLQAAGELPIEDDARDGDSALQDTVDLQAVDEDTNLLISGVGCAAGITEISTEVDLGLPDVVLGRVTPMDNDGFLQAAGKLPIEDADGDSALQATVDPQAVDEGSSLPTSGVGCAAGITEISTDVDLGLLEVVLSRVTPLDNDGFLQAAGELPIEDAAGDGDSALLVAVDEGTSLPTSGVGCAAEIMEISTEVGVLGRDSSEEEEEAAAAAGPLTPVISSDAPSSPKSAVPADPSSPGIRSSEETKDDRKTVSPADCSPKKQSAVPSDMLQKTGDRRLAVGECIHFEEVQIPEEAESPEASRGVENPQLEGPHLDGVGDALVVDCGSPVAEADIKDSISCHHQNASVSPSPIDPTCGEPTEVGTTQVLECSIENEEQAARVDVGGGQGIEGSLDSSSEVADQRPVVPAADTIPSAAQDA